MAKAKTPNDIDRPKLQESFDALNTIVGILDKLPDDEIVRVLDTLRVFFGNKFAERDREQDPWGR